jgi:hypothetical protein
LTSFRTTSVLVLGATVLAALAVRLWPARQEENPPEVPSPAVALAPRGAGGDREFPPQVSEQGVQRGIVRAEDGEAGGEPVATVSEAAVVRSWSDADMLLGPDELRALDRTDRTPRPVVQGCITLPPTAFVCPRGGPLLTEEVDPDWSHATEERLRAIWRENVNVKGISSDFLFVMCKTTLCQINYRFPPGTDESARNLAFSLFDRGLRASDLASELHWVCAGYSGTVVAVGFERNFPQPGPQPPQRAFTAACGWPRLDQPGMN